MISLRQTLQFKTLAVVLSVAALGGVFASCGGSRAQNSKNANASATMPAAPQAVDVTSAPSIMRDLPRFVEATGSLAGDEQTDVAPQVGGRVVSIGVDLGSYVQRGQVIAQLDAGDAQLRLEQSDRKSTRLNSSHANISYAVFCL